MSQEPGCFMSFSRWTECASDCEIHSDDYRKSRLAALDARFDVYSEDSPYFSSIHVQFNYTRSRADNTVIRI